MSKKKKKKKKDFKFLDFVIFKRVNLDIFLIMKSFSAQFRDDPSYTLYEFPCKDTILVSEACEVIRSTFELSHPLSVDCFGTTLPPHKKLSKYCLPKDPLLFYYLNGKNIDVSQIPKGAGPIPRDHWRYYFNISYKSMMEPIDLPTKDDWTQSQLTDFLKKEISKIFPGFNLNDKVILIYLSGGIFFDKGTLTNFSTYFSTAPRHIYVVVSPDLSPKFLFDDIQTLCDIKSNDMKKAFSPLFPTNEAGLYYAASLLGYFGQSGLGTGAILRFIGKFLRFSPLVTSFWRLFMRQLIQGHHLITITSCLLNVFKEIAQGKIKDECLWEKSLPLLTSFIYPIVEIEVECTHYQRPYTPSGYESYILNFSHYENSVVMFDIEFRGLSAIKLTKKFPSLAECDHIFNNDEKQILHPQKPLSLRNASRICLYEGPKGISLFLSQISGKSTDQKDQLNVINPEIGQITKFKPEELASQYRGRMGVSMDKAIVQDPNSIKQLVIVLVDTSGSMGCTFENGIDRCQASQQLFTAFASKSYASRIGSKYGVMIFESSIHVLSELSDLTTDFEKALDKIGPMGGTQMFLGVDQAADKLINVKNQFPNAISRIILVSDGCANSDSRTVSIIQKLVVNNIIVDSLLVYPDIDYRLLAMVRLTGGVIFQINSMVEGLKYLEDEAFFNPNYRQAVPPPVPANQISQNHINEYQSKRNSNFLDKQVPCKQFNLNTNENYSIPLVSIYNNDQKAQIYRDRSIIRQLKLIYNESNEYYKVFPISNKIDEWLVFIRPLVDDSLYKSNWFYCKVVFPSNYPSIPPIITMPQPPFHVNISPRGTICHSYLAEEYNASLTMPMILTELCVLLTYPNYLSPIDDERLQYCRLNLVKPNFYPQFQEKNQLENEYKNKINTSIQNNSRPTLDSWIKSLKIDSNTSHIDIDLRSFVSPPVHFLDPFTHELIVNPVLSSTGTYFEKNSIENQLRSNSNTIDPITGKKLHPINDSKLQIDSRFKLVIDDWKKEKNYIAQKL